MIKMIFAADVIGVLMLAIVVDLITVCSWIHSRWRWRGYVK